MVVHEAHGLHEGVGGRRADEREAAPLEVLAQGDRGGRIRQGEQDPPGQTLRPIGGLGFERPEVRGERALLLGQLAGPARVGDGGLDLAAVADDARVLQEARDVARAEAGHRVEVEPPEGGAEALALPQYRQPAEARLEALQADLLEEPPVVGDRVSPLLVVVPGVERVAARPEAADDPVFAPAQPLRQSCHGVVPPSPTRARAPRERPS